MKKDLVEMVFILDRSGSMSGLESDTIRGFNGFIEKQRKLPGEAIISTVLFDHDFEVLHNRANIQTISPLTTEEYFVRGSTALLDAIGRSILKIVSVYKKTNEKNQPEKTVFIITTDGMENASREFSSRKIKEMIEYQKEKYNWEFIFLGANIDAVETAREFGINSDRAATFHSDKDGTSLNYLIIDQTISELRMTKAISENWKDKIESDYKKRSK